MKIISRATGSLSFCFTTWLSTSAEFLNKVKNTFKFTHLFFNRKCPVSVVTHLIKGEYSKNLLRKRYRCCVASRFQKIFTCLLISK